MLEREQPITRPPTFTVGEVARIFRGDLDVQALQQWDRKHLFRPSYYADSAAASGLVSREERDSHSPTATQGTGLRRLYTFSDLVWLRLLVYVKDRLVERGATNAGAPSARVISALRKITDVPPPASRLLFLGPEIYLLREKAAVCLTGGGQQQILTQVLTDELVAEVEGRVRVLAAHREIREFPLDSSDLNPFQKTKAAT